MLNIDQKEIIVVERTFDEDVLYQYFGRDSSLEKLIIDPKTDSIICDLSQVEYWDLTALLWFVVALKHFLEISNKEILLRLPEEGVSGTSQRSADFLRRWKFGVALSNLAKNWSDLLVYDQKDYFNKENKNYRAVSYDGYSEFEGELISKNLVEIRNLAINGKISSELKRKCNVEFASGMIANVISARAGVDQYLANEFSTVLLGEGLTNIEEHPNASMGMVSVCINNEKNELVLVMVDDGEPIQQTLLEQYIHYLEDTAEQEVEHVKACEGNVFALSNFHKSKILNFATEPGISRKYKYKDYKARDGEYSIGMGLTHIRESATFETKFDGNLRIIAGGVNAKFSMDGYENEYEPSGTNFSRFSWKGNLLRVSIPID